MSPGGSGNKGPYSLFAQEEEVIARAGEMVAKLNQVAEGVEMLVTAYRQQYREQQRLVRLSDRMQLDLHTAKQRLEEQAKQLIELNQSLSEEIKQRELLEAHLRIQATTDSLTGLFSRLHFFELSQREVRRQVRRQSPLSLLLIDLDHFKKINDRFGHSAGDQALVFFADTCRANLRETDIVGRVGGEEFAVLLPDTKLEDALELSRRLLRSLSQAPLQVDSAEIHVSASIGVVVVEPGDDGLRQAYSRADQALYQAKAQGRNRVVAWRGD